jgi:hypothetical protein
MICKKLIINHLQAIKNGPALVLTGRCSHFVSMPEHEQLLRKKYGSTYSWQYSVCHGCLSHRLINAIMPCA